MLFPTYAPKGLHALEVNLHTSCKIVNVSVFLCVLEPTVLPEVSLRPFELRFCTVQYFLNF